LDKLKSIFELRNMLHQMELDIGMGDLSRVERDVLLAAHMLTDNLGDSVETDQIRGHLFVNTLSPATYHRALRSLLDYGFLEYAAGAKSKQYVLRSDLISN
jgi:hypothetical protein